MDKKKRTKERKSEVESCKRRIKFTKKKNKSGKPVKKIPAMTKEHLEKFKKIIISKRDDLLEVIEQKKHRDLSDIEIGDEIDSASQSIEKEMLFELTNNEKIMLDSIEGALRKIETNKFGICESCGNRITTKRLRVMPWARYCIACQKKYERPE